jgi:hypothetical protein
MQPNRLHKIAPDVRAADLAVVTHPHNAEKWAVVFPDTVAQIITSGDVFYCAAWVAHFKREVG